MDTAAALFRVYNARVATRLREHRLTSGQSLSLEHGDLTETQVDALRVFQSEFDKIE